MTKIKEIKYDPEAGVVTVLDSCGGCRDFSDEFFLNFTSPDPETIFCVRESKHGMIYVDDVTEEYVHVSELLNGVN